jgi:hypothetical protein
MRRIVLAWILLAPVLTACTAVGENREPWCRPAPATELMARSVPSATLVPCVRELPSGWVFDGFTASDSGSVFSLAGPEEGGGLVEVNFSDGCEGAAGAPTRSDEGGAQLLEEIRRNDPLSARWTYRFEGGCARIDVSLAAEADAQSVSQELMRALSFVGAASLTAGTNETAASPEA